MRIHLLDGFDRRYLPIPAPRHRDWWQDNDRTKNHAQHCLPLVMANSLGYQILSPATFSVTWNGDIHAWADINVVGPAKPGEITNHAAYGAFVIQPGFIPTTDEVGDFVHIRGIPNERALPYSCMEGLIEAWWNSGQFGIVFLLNQPGKFLISAGQPVAQMNVFKAAGGFAKLDVTEELPSEYAAWYARRHRPEYKKDKDYLQGLHPDGRREETHIRSWHRGNSQE